MNVRISFLCFGSVISAMLVNNAFAQSLPTLDSSMFNHQYNGDSYDADNDYGGGEPFPDYIQNLPFPYDPSSDGNILTVPEPGGGPLFESETWDGTYTTGFTIEFRIKIDPSSPDGPWGTFALYYGDGTAGDIFSVGKSTTFAGVGTVTLDTNSNTDGFHTFRIAEYANGKDAPIDMWRDGVLIGTWYNGGNYNTNLLDWGSGGSRFGPGTFYLDYIRWDDTGAYAPVPTIIPGDFNQDGHVNAADIQAMESALVNVPAYEAAHDLTPAEFTTLGDLNGDGKVTNADVQALLNLLISGGGSTQAVPEPSAGLLLALGGGAMLLWRRPRVRN